MNSTILWAIHLGPIIQSPSHATCLNPLVHSFLQSLIYYPLFISLIQTIYCIHISTQSAILHALLLWECPYSCWAHGVRRAGWSIVMRINHLWDQIVGVKLVKSKHEIAWRCIHILPSKFDDLAKTLPTQEQNPLFLFEEFPMTLKEEKGGANSLLVKYPFCILW